MRIKIIAAVAVAAIASFASASGARASVFADGNSATGTSAAVSTGTTMHITSVHTYRINATSQCRSVEGQYTPVSSIHAFVVFSNYFCWDGSYVWQESYGFIPKTTGAGWNYLGETDSKNCYVAAGAPAGPHQNCSGNHEWYHAQFCVGNPYRGGCSQWWNPTINQEENYKGQYFYNLSS